MGNKSYRRYLSVLLSLLLPTISFPSLAWAITESQDAQGWKEPQSVIWSNLPAQDAPRASSTGLSLNSCFTFLQWGRPHLLVRWNFLCISWCLLCFILLLGTTEQSLHPSSTLSPQMLTLTRSLSQLSLHKAENSHCPQPFLIREMLLFLNHLCSPLLDSL